MTYADPRYPARRYSYVEQYRERSFAVPTQMQPHPITVKVEDVDAQDTLPNSSHSPYSQQPVPSYFRFGGSTGTSSLASSSPTTPVTPFTFMSGSSWPSSSSSHAAAIPGTSYQQQYQANRVSHGYSMHGSLDSHQHHSAHVLPPLQDDYDDGDDDGLAELPPGASLNGYTSSGLDGTGSGLTKAGEKQVRRRSSKACDQCRKSKCKCERSTSQEPCKNCVLLGTGTFKLLPLRSCCACSIEL